jgi:hypothetical protein
MKKEKMNKIVSGLPAIELSYEYDVDVEYVTTPPEHPPVAQNVIN